MSVGLIVAFVAGFLTFFATCLIPVLPAYVAYLGGTAVKDGYEDGRFLRRRLIINSIIFSAGFVLVFLILGLAASHIGNIFTANRDWFQKVGGFFLVSMGVYMLEIFKVSSFFKSFQFSPSQKLRATKWGAFLFGLTFGFAWTPCIGPVLASILFISSQVSVGYGALLLLIFGFGMALPFILVAFIFDAIRPFLKKVSSVSVIIRVIAGLVLILVGVLLFTNHLGLLSEWTLQFGVPAVLHFEGL